MSIVKGLLFVYFISAICTTVNGVICLFYHLKADCDYPLDGFSMTRIQATINECNDPPDISFRITCNKPKLDWSRTFSGAIDTKEIRGYTQRVFLQVKQKYSSDTGKYSIKATVLADHSRDVEIMSSVIKLIRSDCSLLNNEAKIAVAVLGSLAGIALVAVIVLIVIRRWRLKPLTYQSTGELVLNAELPENTPQADSSSPARTNVTGHQARQEVQDMVTYSGLVRNDHQRF